MIRVLSITLQGFRSFTQAQTFVLPRGAGFYFMGGENLAEPALGANGVGKSTVWDAPLWCVTGKTSRGLKAGAVANWESTEPCRVAIGVMVSTPANTWETWTIARTWSPNSLAVLKEGTTEWQPVTQEELERGLGANFEILTSTLLMSQFGRYFFDLTATEKLTLFSGLFDLDFWLDCADRAKAAVRKAEERASQASQALASAEGALQALRPRLTEAKAKSAEWQAEYERRNTEAQTRLRQRQDLADDSRWKAKKARQQQMAAEAVKSDAQRVLVTTDNHLRDEVLPYSRESKQKVEHLEAAVRVVEDEIASARDLGEGRCPTCYQKVDRNRLTRAILSIETERLAPLVQELSDATVAAASMRRQVTKATEARQKAEEDYVAAEKRVDKARRAASDLSEIASDHEASLKQAETQWRAAKDQKNPYEETVQQCREAIRTAKESVAAAEVDLAAARKQIDRAGYWVGAFKDLRLWVIERALLDFEVCVNNALLDLGLDGWKVTFDIERENKSGGVTKGFTVLIHSPGSKGPVPWEAWSGGETQRLRIAGAIGLSDLVRSQRGFQVNLEVWDEPTAHLSREGVEDLLRFFRSRAQEQKKQVWLVDHVALLGGDFDGQVMVRRDVEGSHFGSRERPRRRVVL